jgi:multisubunit Na+/H+ antiporter MnhB subunit
MPAGGLAVLPIEMAIYRGAIAFFVIAAGLCVLARLERSPGLAVVAALHAGAAVLAAAYDVENLVFRLGWSPQGDQWRYAGLPNVLLPALVLLAGGAAAAVVQLRQRATA